MKLSFDFPKYHSTSQKPDRSTSPNTASPDNAV
jgi:hypothetical protein